MQEACSRDLSVAERVYTYIGVSKIKKIHTQKKTRNSGGCIDHRSLPKLQNVLLDSSGWEK